MGGRKKKQAKTQPKEQEGAFTTTVCKDFQAGKCTRGDKCKFAHVGPARKQIQCRDFLAGKCGRGDACKYRHGPWRSDMQDMGEDSMLCQTCPPAPVPMDVPPPVYRIVSTAPQPVPQPIRRIVRYVTTTNRVQPPPPPPAYGMQEPYSPQYIGEEGYPHPQGWESEPGSTLGCPPGGCWDAEGQPYPDAQAPYPVEPPVDMLRHRLEVIEAEAARLKAEADAAEAHAAALRANVVSPPRDSGACSEGKSEDTSPTPPYTGEASDASERSGSPSDEAADRPRYVRHDPYAL